MILRTGRRHDAAVRQGGLGVSHERLTREEAAEELRKKDRYRQLILSGRIVLPYRSAAKLLGPDCLYHLYSALDPGKSPKDGGRGAKLSGSRKHSTKRVRQAGKRP